MAYSSENANISIVYHSHNDTCYELCDNIITSYSSYNDDITITCCDGTHGVDHYVWKNAQLASGTSYKAISKCESCGAYWSYPSSSSYSNKSYIGSTLGKYSVLSCGKTTDTIESATIVFE